MARVEAEIGPDTMDYLQREAVNRGIPVEQLAGDLLERAADLSAAKSVQEVRQTLSPERKVELLLELIKKQSPKVPPIPLEALDRNNLYDADE